MEKYFQIKTKWSKAYAKMHFTTGIHTNQRVESIHSCLKRELNKNSSLTEVLNFINNKTYEANLLHVEEIGTYLSKSSGKNFDKLNVVKYWKEKISEFIMQKLKFQIELSLHYKLSNHGENKW